MTNEELKNIDLPQYSSKEDKINCYSHVAGIFIGLIIFIICLTYTIIYKCSFNNVISIIIYGISMMTLYSVSSLYHGAKANSQDKKIKRVLDHCTIYFLIAGTYTPICIINNLTTSSIILLIIQWVMASLGIILNAYDFNKKSIRIISIFLYIILGWSVMIFPSIWKSLPYLSFLFILLGGISYTIGSILYGIGHKKRIFHCIFHFFCLIGTILQGIGIIFLIIS